MDLREQFPSLGFLGAGNMATAMLRAVIAKKLLPPKSCLAFDVVPEKVGHLVKELGIQAQTDPVQFAESCSSLVLATKPQDLRKALDAIRSGVHANLRIVSIAAGVPCKTIEAALPAGTRVVRVMPNTPALIGMGAAGIAGGTHATKNDIEAVLALFQAVGEAYEVTEDQLDAITALSGSGPAYVFRFMELIHAAGEEMGLDSDLARRLTLQTFVGSAHLAKESPESPAELRRRVTSPGGTTAAALEVFEKRELDKIVKDGLKAARDRSIELAQKF